MLTVFFQFETLEILGDSSPFSECLNRGGSSNPCIFGGGGGEQKKKKKEKEVQTPAAQLLSDMSRHEHCLYQFLFKYRVHLKGFVQLFKANLNFVLTREITSSSVITVNQKHLRLSDSKDSSSVVQKTIFLGTRPW